MYITTYVNDSDEHVLDKSITKVHDNISVNIKDDTNLINPVIIVSGSLTPSYNYIYITDFNRYYYVRDITYSQQRYYIALEVDVLMSFNAAIKALDVIANRSSSRFNVYQPDDSIPFLQRNIIATQKFPSGFGSESLILAVNGD